MCDAFEALPLVERVLTLGSYYSPLAENFRRHVMRTPGT